MYYAYFSVLAEYVKHHIKEEEKELFPAVKTMKALDAQRLAEDMRARREGLFAEIEEAGGERSRERLDKRGHNRD
jgi:hemerythrin-like domain-containing protein